MAVNVLAPPVGTTVDNVTIAEWYRREGETVTAGEPLLSVETDKATLDIEAPASGILRTVSAPAGATVHALSVIAVIDDNETLNHEGREKVREQAPPQEPQKGKVDEGQENVHPGGGVRASTAREQGQQSAVGGQENTPARLHVFISPRARRLAETEKVPWETLRGSGTEGAIVERDVRAFLSTRSMPTVTPVAQRVASDAGVDWKALEGTGLGGRVVRADVARVAAARSLPASPPSDELLETIPVRGVRAVIAERMLTSHMQTARVTLTSEADAAALVELRSNLQADGISVSYNDLFIAILARSLREHPRLNASLQGNAIQVWSAIHIGLAVDTARGLLVPVVRHADQKGLRELVVETQRLIQATVDNTIAPEELRGGTFTLTNLGMYGIDMFTPVINLPETAILGVGRIRPQPAVRDGQVVVRPCVWLSLTFDHRVVDGGPAARFLQRVVQFVEKPHLLLT